MPLLNISPPRFTSAARCLARRYSASAIPHYVSLYHCKTLLLQPSQFLCYTSHNYIAQFFALPLRYRSIPCITFALPINPYNRPALLYHTFAGQYFSLRCLCFALLRRAQPCLCFANQFNTVLNQAIALLDITILCASIALIYPLNLPK